MAYIIKETCPVCGGDNFDGTECEDCELDLSDDTLGI